MFIVHATSKWLVYRIYEEQIHLKNGQTNSKSGKILEQAHHEKGYPKGQHANEITHQGNAN